MNTQQIAETGTWTLGALIWLPVAALLIAGSAALAALLFKWAEQERDKAYGDRGMFLAFAWCSVALAASFAIGTGLGMYPYKAEYHQWREVGGTITQIDKRLIGTGDGMEEKFVVRFADDSQQFGCDDTRCAGVEVGDALTLSCKRQWQYTGTDGYDCRFVSTDPA